EDEPVVVDPLALAWIEIDEPGGDVQPVALMDALTSGWPAGAGPQQRFGIDTGDLGEQPLQAGARVLRDRDVDEPLRWEHEGGPGPLPQRSVGVRRSLGSRHRGIVSQASEGLDEHGDA